jgi:hypothetical protein
MKSGKKQTKLFNLIQFNYISYNFSTENFKPINDILLKQTQKSIDIELVSKQFKEHLFENIKRNFTKLWNELNMEGKLTVLEYSKKHCVTETPWRPALVPAEDQMRTHMMQEFAKKKDYLQKQIAKQEAVISVS